MLWSCLKNTRQQNIANSLTVELNSYKAPTVNFEYYFLKYCVEFSINNLDHLRTRVENRWYNKFYPLLELLISNARWVRYGLEKFETEKSYSKWNVQGLGQSPVVYLQVLAFAVSGKSLWNVHYPRLQFFISNRHLTTRPLPRIERVPRIYGYILFPHFLRGALPTTHNVPVSSQKEIVFQYSYRTCMAYIAYRFFRKSQSVDFVLDRRWMLDVLPDLVVSTGKASWSSDLVDYFCSISEMNDHCTITTNKSFRGKFSLKYSASSTPITVFFFYKINLFRTVYA